jgi:hypothetical protein
VVERFRRDDHSRSFAEILVVCVTLFLVRLCFPTVGNKTAFGFLGVNLLRIDGLWVFEPGILSGDWTLDQRLGVAVLYLLVQFLLRLFEGIDLAQPKVVVFDEAWMLTATA